jgi:hypothetical protein
MKYGLLFVHYRCTYSIERVYAIHIPISSYPAVIYSKNVYLSAGPWRLKYCMLHHKLPLYLLYHLLNGASAPLRSDLPIKVSLYITLTMTLIFSVAQ